MASQHVALPVISTLIKGAEVYLLELQTVYFLFSQATLRQLGQNHTHK